MTLRLPLARWLLSKSLPVDLIYRYLYWLRFCAEKFCQNTYKFEDWKFGQLGQSHQLLVASSETSPPVLLEFAESRFTGAVRRAITAGPKVGDKRVSTEEQANHVFAAMSSSSFRL